MPELPEVEITRRGLEPHVVGHRIRAVVIRNARLRFPIAAELPQLLAGLVIQGIRRRAKYLLLDCGRGWLILHLGMSGSLRVLSEHVAAEKHDHFELVLETGRCIRLRDPRRFGAVIWTETDPMRHPLLADLGVEPFDPAFDGRWLHQATRGRRSSIKQTLMDSHLIVGVGNIYANEALFQAGIRPTTPAQRIGPNRCGQLAAAIRDVLQRAIAAGGSSLRDFVDSAGNPGYFQQQYAVYGRAGEPCRRCGSLILQLRLGQRSTFFCPHCQG